MSDTDSKYDIRRNIRDTAKLVRADLKAAVKAGKLPADFTASVRIDRYSMGQSLYVTMKAPSVQIHNVGRVRHDMQHPHEYTQIAWMSSRAREIVEVVKDLVNAYNRKDIDSQADHFDVHFWDHVDWSDEQADAQRRELEATLRAAYRVAPGEPTRPILRAV